MLAFFFWLSCICLVDIWMDTCIQLWFFFSWIERLLGFLLVIQASFGFGGFFVRVGID